MLRVLVSLLLFGDCHGTYLLAYLLVRHLVCSSPVLRFVVVPSWCVRIVSYCTMFLPCATLIYRTVSSFHSSSRRFVSVNSVASFELCDCLFDLLDSSFSSFFLSSYLLALCCCGPLCTGFTLGARTSLS